MSSQFFFYLSAKTAIFAPQPQCHWHSSRYAITRIHSIHFSAPKTPTGRRKQGLFVAKTSLARAETKALLHSNKGLFAAKRYLRWQKNRALLMARTAFSYIADIWLSCFGRTFSSFQTCRDLVK